MNAAHVHLLLNHVPVIGALFAVGVLAVGLFWKRDELVRAAAGLFAAAALFAAPVYLSGEPAEEVVESLPGVSEPVIERHEDAAAVAFATLAVVGVLSLTALVLFRRQVVPVTVARAGLALGLIALALMGYTANLGGQIRHTEIRARVTGADAPAGVLDDD